MELIPIRRGDLPLVDGYGPGQFRVAGTVHNGSIILTSRGVIPWAVADFQTLTEKSFQPLLDLSGSFEVVLLGCGPATELIHSNLKLALKAKGLVLDPMPTAAACRTYNLMLGEDRRAAACLIAL